MVDSKKRHLLLTILIIALEQRFTRFYFLKKKNAVFNFAGFHESKFWPQDDRVTRSKCISGWWNMWIFIPIAGFRSKFWPWHNCVTRSNSKVPGKIRTVCCAELAQVYIDASGAVWLCCIVKENLRDFYIVMATLSCNDAFQFWLTL